MKLISLLTKHSHYWGVPHEREYDKQLVQTCYECGADRLIKIDLRPSWVPTEPTSTDREPKVLN